MPGNRKQMALHYHLKRTETEMSFTNKINVEKKGHPGGKFPQPLLYRIAMTGQRLLTSIGNHVSFNQKNNNSRSLL